MTESRTLGLLKLSGVLPSDEKAEEAAAWLSAAIDGARPLLKIAKELLPAAEHNELLADIETTAKKLIKRIERLRRYPASWRAFWRSSAFGPVYLDRVEVKDVTSALERVIRAAATAKDPRQGRRREVDKQNIVNLAL